MGKRILMFESDSAFAHSVSQALGRSGITVDVVEDGKRGCELAVQTKPDLILLNIELPQMNGFLVCKKLKNAPETAAIPIIILSAEATDEIFEEHRNLRTRADVYFKKPVEIDTLIEKIRALVPAPDGNVSQPLRHDLEATESPRPRKVLGSVLSLLWFVVGFALVAVVLLMGFAMAKNVYDIASAWSGLTDLARHKVCIPPFVFLFLVLLVGWSLPALLREKPSIASAPEKESSVRLLLWMAVVVVAMGLIGAGLQDAFARRAIANGRVRCEDAMSRGRWSGRSMTARCYCRRP